MSEINYDDAERRAYVTASPTAALPARISDLEHERDELRAEVETVREMAYAEGYSAGQDFERHPRDLHPVPPHAGRGIQDGAHAATAASRRPPRDYPPAWWACLWLAAVAACALAWVTR